MKSVLFHFVIISCFILLPFELYRLALNKVIPISDILRYAIVVFGALFFLPMLFLIIENKSFNKITPVMYGIYSLLAATVLGIIIVVTIYVEFFNGTNYLIAGFLAILTAITPILLAIMSCLFSRRKTRILENLATSSVFVNDRSSKPWKTIDHERNITLINTGVSVDGEWFFDLYIKDRKYTFDALLSSEITNNHLQNIKWKIIRTSAAMSDQLVRSIIKKSLEAHGLIYSREKVENVTVEFLV